MNFKRTVSRLLAVALASLAGCGPVTEREATLENTTGGQQVETLESLLTTTQKRARCDAIKSVASAMDITNPLIFAGVANHETGLAQCWSEATWACQGPYSSDCGGPAIAGSGDGACSLQQGGLGMYQLDSGTYTNTLNQHGSKILNVQGNAEVGVDFIVYKVRVCPNTRDLFTSDAQAIAWLNSARPGTSAYEEFLTAMAWCYNGCGPTCSNHSAMRQNYRDATTALHNLFGDSYWYASKPNRLDAFVIGTGGNVYQKYYQTGAGWSALSANQGAPSVGTASDPAAVSWGEGRIDLFVRGGDNAIWHKWFTSGAWSGWQSLSGGLISAPDVASWGAGRLDVFAVGPNGSVYQKYYESGSGWSTWVNQGAPSVGIKGGPSAVSWGSGRLDVFVRGGDNAIWHKWFSSSGWSGWESLGGTLSSDPDVASWGAGRLDVFAVGPSGDLYHKYHDGGSWSAWSNQGVPSVGFTSSPGAVSWGSSRLDLFVRGGDNAMWHKWWNGSWSGWESLGGVLTSGPDAASWSRQ